ncbi:MAG TPA: radical SAM protein [Candidatus Hypogeohydataceae bacterium YC41]
MFNYLSAGLAILEKPIQARNRPLHLQVEPTNRCNLQCIFCSREKYLGALEDLSLEHYEELLSEVRPKRVTYAGAGEPLLNPHLPEMIALASKMGCHTVVTTNFIKGEKLAEELVRSGLTGLRVSLDGATPETYKAIRGADFFEKILQGISKVNEYKKRLGKTTPTIGIEFVVQGRNLREMPQMIRLASEYAVHNVNFRPLNLIGKEEREELLRAGLGFEEYSSTLKETFMVSKELGVNTNLSDLLKDLPFYWSGYSKSENQINGKVCLHLWLQVFVSASGEITPCCALQMDEGISMGNVFSSPFETVWNGERYLEFRRRFKEDKITYKSCRTCYRIDLPTLVRKTLRLPGLR